MGADYAKSNLQGRHGGSSLPPGSIIATADSQAQPSARPSGHPSPAFQRTDNIHTPGSGRHGGSSLPRDATAFTRDTRHDTPSPGAFSQAMRAPHLSKTTMTTTISDDSQSDIEMQTKNDGIVDHVPAGQRNRLHQKGYGNIFNSGGSRRHKRPKHHQHAALVYQSTERHRYRDAVGRVYTGIEEDRFILPYDVHLARLLVQTTDDVYSGPGNATWRRTFIRNVAPYIIRVANWPFNSVKADKEYWDSTDWTMIILKWPVSCLGLAILLIKPGRVYQTTAPNGCYQNFSYKFWGYPKVARNAMENARGKTSVLGESEGTHPVADRPIHPRRLCFLDPGDKDDSRITLYDVDLWLAKHNLIEHDMQYVFVAYTSNQFSESEEDTEALHAIARKAARDANVSAYWLGSSCMSSEKEELEKDVYRISDVIRGAHSVTIAISGHGLEVNGAAMVEKLLKDWGTRMWTLPEALLSPHERLIRVYTAARGSARLVKEVAKKNLAALIWSDSALTRQLVEHYEGNLTLSRLELVIIALRCLSSRATAKYLDGDMAYVLMGLLRQRPLVDHTDSDFQAFARLSLANDSDMLLERLICVLPRSLNQPWYHTEDAYNANLWDIQPTCQIAGVGEDDTVILDGCHGATIRWESFLPVAHSTGGSRRRRWAARALRLSALCFFVGILCALFGLLLIGAPLIVIGLVILLASPYLVRVCYGGKGWNVAPYFLAFEGYLDIQTIESNIYGTYAGRLSWSIAGSDLSQHKKNQWGECIGEDPTNDPHVANFVKQAKYSKFGQQKVFSLVDTHNGTVTLFSAVRPPIAVLLCAQEGGMQRAVMVSLDWKRQTLYRETVLRMPTMILEKMFRVDRMRLGLKRPLDPTAPRGS